MPIKRQRNSRRRITRRLAIGERVPIQGSNKTRPGKLDHFQFRRKVGHKMWEVDTTANERFGGRPTAISVILCNDDPEKVLDSGLASFRSIPDGKYKRQVLYCHGDNETAYRLISSAGPERRTLTCDKNECPVFQDGDCKPYGVFHFQVPELGGGIVEFKTSSWNTIDAVEAALEEISGITGGILAGIPVTLVVRPEMVRAKARGGQLTKIYIVDIEYDIREVQHAARMMKDLRSSSTAPRRTGAVEAPPIGEWEEDDHEEFAEEFHDGNGAPRPDSRTSDAWDSPEERRGGIPESVAPEATEPPDAPEESSDEMQIDAWTNKIEDCDDIEELARVGFDLSDAPEFVRDAVADAYRRVRSGLAMEEG